MIEFAEAVRVIDQVSVNGSSAGGLCPLCGNRRVRIVRGPKAEAVFQTPECDCRHPAILQEVAARLKSGYRPKVAVNGSHPETSVVNVVLSSVVNDLKPPTELEPEALYGLPGQVINAIEPHTESHQAAILASFLVGVGCLIGRGPHIYRDGARHTCNEFALLVGMTAKGRKGTATRRTDEIFKCLSDSESTKEMTHDMRPYSELVMSGLGSGEALIEALADEDEDKRRIVFEEEFSKPLKVMRREGSILSETLRAAWDGGILSNRTKGKQLIAMNTHVAILGHVTEQELHQEMGTTSVYNGFGNRFLVFCTQRSKSLPFGGGRPHLAPVVSQLRSVLDYSELIGDVEFDEDAKRLWDEGGIYDLLIDRPEGLLGAVTSRAEAHVTRLALLYAVLDAAREVGVPHLLAALAVWDYSEKSCRYIFGTATGDDYADLIEERAREVYPGGLTRTDIRDIFNRNAVPGRIPKALATLEANGKLEKVSVPGEKGRPTEYWRFSNDYDRRQNDINDKSPLQRARELLS